MKGFLKWFKSGTKIKRWMFLMLVGIVLVCYGIAKVMVTDQISFKEVAIIIASFVAGFTFTVISMICIQRRTLELFVEESDTRNTEQNGSVKSLIFNKKVYNQGPKVVVIGGGAGLNTVLRGLKNYTDNITAIVTISDYGEETNRARKSLNTLPLDDVKDSLIALASHEEEMSALFNLNMQNSKFDGLRFSDVYLTAMKEAVGDFTESIEESSKILNITGKVMPVTLDQIKICAELEDGTVVESKNRIPEMVSQKVSRISRIYISPTNIRVAPGVIEAINEADAIVIGPGSLYTNVIPNLLVPGVSKAIREAKGFKVYVSNIMTEYGQTDNYSLYDHIKAIIDHAGKGIVDYCIYDTGEIVPEYIRQYNKEGSDLVEQDVAKVKEEGIRLIQRNLSTIENDRIRHNPDAIATSIMELICDDMKFRDMQNDTQYMMLDSRIKNTNKKLKKNKKKKEKTKNKEKHSSKFFEKYNERIISIQESTNKKPGSSNSKAKKNQIINIDLTSKNEKTEKARRPGRPPKINSNLDRNARMSEPNREDTLNKMRDTLNRK